MEAGHSHGHKPHAANESLSLSLSVSHKSDKRQIHKYKVKYKNEIQLEASQCIKNRMQSQTCAIVFNILVFEVNQRGNESSESLNLTC